MATTTLTLRIELVWWWRWIVSPLVRALPVVGVRPSESLMGAVIARAVRVRT